MTRALRHCIRWAILTVLCVSVRFSHAQQDLKLWYKQPAKKWTEALPIGNGRLGAMIYGGVLQEHVQFNEETLWTGEPREHARAGAYQYLPQIRKLLEEGKQKEAEDLAEQHFMGRKSNEEAYPDEQKAWLSKVVSDSTLASLTYEDHSWQPVNLPARQGWESVGLDGLNGAVWCNHSFELPPTWKGKDLVLKLGRIRDMDVTYVNGMKIGSTEGKDDREYRVPAGLLRPGKNKIAIQVINFFDKGGLVGRKEDKNLVIHPTETSEVEGIDLSSGWRYHIQDDTPPAFPRYEADYQPFGDVWFTFNHKKVSDYKRDLTLQNAVAGVSYMADGVKYQREYFASAVHDAVVMHFTADRKASISLTASMTSPHRNFKTERSGNTLKLSLQVQHGALRGMSYLTVEIVKGTLTVNDHQIVVTGANEATFYLTAGTNYKNYRDTSGDPEERCRKPLAEIARHSYDQIRQQHVKEYQQFFNTLSINLGTSANGTLPTNERILKYTHSEDPSFIALYLQYARYLMISSSRPGTNAINLQGIWNDLLLPPWGSKYTTNINLEMNYWPADLLNLSSCFDPCWKLTEEVATTGKTTAKEHYNLDGWVLHHNTDLWRATTPINAANHGIWVTGGAWLCHQLWDHYLFTGDENFLRKAYPVMKEAAVFFRGFLVEDPTTGWLISTPSNSPEQGGLVAGPTMDHQLIRDLFKNCIAASQIVDQDEEFRDQLRTMYDRIAPNQIGRHGQLQEWLEDKDDPDNKHRHVSHLWGVYPGTDITWDNSSRMMEAAKQSLLFRGDGGTGWSLAWKVNLWARFRDGDHTLLMIDKLLEPAAAELKEKGGVYFNMFDAHPPFQIDGNFGGAAGIVEMLVQSHQGYIELLPALPKALPDGEIEGVCVRGNFVLKIRWKNGKLEQVTVISGSGNDCTLKYQQREFKFSTEKNKQYKFSSELKMIN